MCQLCFARALASNSRRGFLLAAGAAAAAPALAQVDVGKASSLRNLVPADKLEAAAVQQYGQLLTDDPTLRASFTKLDGTLLGESDNLRPVDLAVDGAANLKAAMIPMVLHYSTADPMA